VQCGAPVPRDQGIDRGQGVEHLVCAPTVVADLERRLEAARALDRALGALGALEPLRERVRVEALALPDVVDPRVAREALARLETIVALTRFARLEQRKLALSLLETLARRLEALR
jgi:hypothetical protein